MSKLSLSRSLYDPAAVTRAAEAFAALGTIGVEVGDDAIVVTVTDADPDVAEVIEDELLNHALSHSIALYRQRSRSGHD